MEINLFTNPFNQGFENDLLNAKKALSRYFLIKKILEKNDDNQLLNLLNILLNSIKRYIELVCNFGINMALIRKETGSTGKIYQEKVVELDKNRKIAHDSLIANLTSFNRNLGKKYGWETNDGEIPLGGIYTLDPNYITNRKEIGRWAWFLVLGLYQKEINKRIRDS